MDTPSLTVDLVKIPVRDIETASRFYREVLGLSEEFAVPQYGWAQYDAGAVPLCLYVPGMGGGDGTPGGETGVHLVSIDLGALHTRVVERGGTATEIVSSDDGGRFCVVSDPDGNTIKIVQRMWVKSTLP